MARLFVRLKLALLAGGFRRGWQQLVGTLVGVVLLLPIGVLGGLVLAYAGRAEFGLDLIVLLVAVSGGLWIIGPPLFFGVDETLDPSRLALLPLRRRDLAVGMTTASLIGVGPAVTALLLTGAVLGSARSVPAGLVGVAAAVLHLAACVLGSRAITTSLSNRLRSRRGRDLVGMLLVLGIVVSSQLPNLALNVFGVQGMELRQALAQSARVAGLLPIGWAGAAMATAAVGRYATALGFLAGLAAVIVGLALWWLRALDALATSPEQTRSARADDAPLLPRFLPVSRLGAAAARELRYYAREPRYRLAVIIQIAFGVTITVIAAIGLPRDPRVTLIVAAIALPMALGALNAFGSESGATWLLVSVGGNHRADLAGKNLAGLLIALPLVVLATITLATLSAGWVYAPVGLVLFAAAYALACGVGDVSSVLVPFPQPELGGNVFGARSGANALTALLQTVALGAIALLLAPVIAATVATALLAPGWLALVAPLALVYGAVIYRTGLGIAARRMASHGPEILVALSEGRR